MGLKRPPETVTVCGLHKSLRTTTPTQHAALIKHITDISTSVSIASRRGSLFANYHFTRLLQNNLPLPTKTWKEDTFWRRILLVGDSQEPSDDAEQASPPDPQQAESWQQVKAQLPVDPKSRRLNDWASLSYASQSLKTCFFNNIWVPLGARITRLCKVSNQFRGAETTRCAMRTASARLTHPPPKCRCAQVFLQTRESTSRVATWRMVRAVEDGQADDKLPEDVVAFVQLVRAQLLAARPLDGASEPAKPTTLINDRWAKKNLARVYRFNYWMLTWLRETKQAKHAEVKKPRRGIRLAPVCKVSRKFAVMDGGVLLRALRCCSVITKEQEKACAADADVLHGMVSSYFHMPQPAKRVWTLIMNTDGVSAHYHSVNKLDWERFGAFKAEGEVRKAVGKAVAAEARKAADARKAAGLPELVVEEEEEEEKPKVKRKPKVEEEDPVQPLLRELGVAPADVVVLGVDPGRRNIVYASARVPGEQECGAARECFHPAASVKPPGERVMTWSLTARDYYRLSGVNTHARKLAAWHQSRLAAWSQLGDLKTGDCVDVLGYMAQAHAISQGWWDEVLKRRHGRWRACIHRSKRSAVDTFWGGVKRDVEAALRPSGKRVVVAYGGATFSASGIGNLTVPTTAMYKACARQLPTCLQTEFRTSQVCPRCHAQVHKVWCSLDPFQEGGFYRHGKETPYKKEPGVLEVRGLLFCPDCSKYMNRDKVGSLNIGDNLKRRVLEQPLLEAFTWMRKEERKKRLAARLSTKKK